VLHAVAGPVNGHTFLREARWANETLQLALLENRNSVSQLRTFFRKAHAERLQTEHAVNVDEEMLPSATLSDRGLSLLLGATLICR
jgi:hypothetical protein